MALAKKKAPKKQPKNSGGIAGGILPGTPTGGAVSSFAYPKATKLQKNAAKPKAKKRQVSKKPKRAL